MFQLTYQSKIAPELTIDQIENILIDARKRNNARNITGCLVYFEESIVQILEGEKNDVMDLFGKIEKDNRHHTLDLLWQGTSDQRYFPNWDMALYAPVDASHYYDSKEVFVTNMTLLADLSKKTTATLLSFWSTVRKKLNE
ncbi:BLUF domain-containing protein [Maribacter huludaoensis]|uniref:BLUF domain-containing protein n=1 Tax=Maribacter huludaoensis TaxID=3030010 RepID=UPI0023EA91BD|nr:BLUF domain-containing protein [Maribacter huludaoensis]MDF4220870.1 BLUF domain-containing protein [Maribacter huludaoensis]